MPDPLDAVVNRRIVAVKGDLWEECQDPFGTLYLALDLTLDDGTVLSIYEAPGGLRVLTHDAKP